MMLATGQHRATELHPAATAKGLSRSSAAAQPRYVPHPAERRPATVKLRSNSAHAPAPPSGSVTRPSSGSVTSEQKNSGAGSLIAIPTSGISDWQQHVQQVGIPGQALELIAPVGSQWP